LFVENTTCGNRDDRVVCFASVAFDKYSILWCCCIEKKLYLTIDAELL
jgi:hypothetical protein